MLPAVLGAGGAVNMSVAQCPATPRDALAAGAGGGPPVTTNRGDAEALAELQDMNFYDALGVQPGATNAEVRRAF